MSRPERNPIERYPVRIAGIEWRNLQKGQVIPSHLIEEAHEILWEGQSPDQPEMRVLKVKGWLEKARNEIGEPLVIVQERGTLRILTDSEAMNYVNGKANAGLRQHARHSRRLFSDIDSQNLSQSERDKLMCHQQKHAVLSAAINNARRQVVRELKRQKHRPQIEGEQQAS